MSDDMELVRGFGYTLQKSRARLGLGSERPPTIDAATRERIVRYRKMGYSPRRIAELFELPRIDVRLILRARRLA